jgi:hypothetical protein
MRAFFASAVLTFASAEQMFDTAELARLIVSDKVQEEPVLLSHSVTKSASGAIVEEHRYEDLVEKTITFPAVSFADDFEQRAEHLRSLTEHIRDQK